VKERKRKEGKGGLGRIVAHAEEEGGGECCVT